jgi:Fic family protein
MKYLGIEILDQHPEDFLQDCLDIFNREGTVKKTCAMLGLSSPQIQPVIEELKSRKCLKRKENSLSYMVIKGKVNGV